MLILFLVLQEFIDFTQLSICCCICYKKAEFVFVTGSCNDYCSAFFLNSMLAPKILIRARLKDQI